jgi:chloride channel protein, CIC family
VTARQLGDFTTDRRVLLLGAMSLVVGSMGAGAAWALIKLIGLVTNLVFFGRLSTSSASPAGNHLGAWILVIPVAGGLVIGFMARFGSEKIRGHGIPEAMEAILIGGSRVEPKVAVLKPLSSALSIGTGGPFGSEGPIIMTGGAFGSLFAQFFHLTGSERKTLLVAGAAAGMSATFGAPVAAVLIAVELLLFEWKPRSFIPVAIASSTAAAIRPYVIDRAILFPVAPHVPLGARGLVAALALGVLAGVASSGLTAMVYGAEDLFGRLPIHWMWWPAIGGLIVGLGGLIEPRALGVGYENIRSMLDGRFVGTALLSLLIVKAIIWSLSLGSGTSGGVLAPLLMMGGAIGVLTARWLGLADAGFGAMIGMAAMLGGTMRSPLTALVFTFELTHDPNALLPLLVACSASFAVTVLVMPRSILTEKVARRGHHVVREYSVDPLELTRVRQVMSERVEPLPATMPAGDAVVFFGGTEDAAKSHAGYPVVDGGGKVVGVVTRSDVMADTVSDDDRVADLMTVPAIVATLDEPVARAAERMALSGVGRLPVVDRDGALAGILSRRDVLRARADAASAESLRERIRTPVRRRAPGAG